MDISSGTKANFQRAIMEEGFYPEELPPCFEVKRFYDAARKEGWLTNQSSHGAFDFGDGNYELARYNVTKRNFQRRVFSCPNPIFFIRMAFFFGKHRKEISEHITKNGKHFSCSIPQLDTDGHRALRIDSFNDFDEKRRQKLSAYPFLVKADTSRFYPSLYTHVIPWAYEGKERAKARNNKRLYIDHIDHIISQAQRGQTIGLPIGPDVSRIVAEIVSVAIDAQFKENMGCDVEGVRLVDDAYFGADSHDHARKILTAYKNALRHFELDVNEAKTFIIQTKMDLKPYWVLSLSRDIREGYYLSEALDNVIRQANVNNDDGIIKYALRQIDKFRKSRLWSKKWNEIESFLVLFGINFPHSLPVIAKIISSRVRSGFQIDSEKWKKVCHQIINEHAPYGNDEEVLWSCWILKHLEVSKKVSKSMLSVILKNCGPFPSLMAIDLAETESKKMQEEACELVIDRLLDKPMCESDWLLSYEAERLFEYPLREKNRKEYKIMDDLIKHKVQFYDKNCFAPSFKSEDEPMLDDFNSSYDDIQNEDNEFSF